MKIMINRPLCVGMGSFSILWFGEVLSLLGTGMTGFAIGVDLYRDTGSVTLFGMLSLSMILPLLVFSPLAGKVADLFDRRLVLLGVNLGLMIGTALLLELFQRGLIEPWHLYVILAVNSAFTTFAWPALSAATTLIVGKDHLGRASGMTQMGASLSQIVAPLLGGLLLDPVGVEAILLLDLVSFLVPCLVLLAMVFPQPKPASELLTAGQAVAGATVIAPGASAVPAGSGLGGVGWHFIRERPGLLSLLLLLTMLNFCTGIVQVLVTPLVLSFSNPSSLGIVLAIASSGSLVGGIMMSIWGGPLAGRRVLAILAMVACSGVCLLLGGLAPSISLISSGAFFFMLTIPLVSGSSQIIWQSKVPTGIQGQVFAIRRLIAFGALPLSFALAGPLADNIFEPLMAPGGRLALILGPLIGVGTGRGIGLILVLSGVALLVLAGGGLRVKRLRRLETDVPDADDIPESVHRPEQLDTTAVRALDQLHKAPALALAVVLVALAGSAFWLERPPAELPDLGEVDFEIERVEADLAKVAAEPHPTGSEAQGRVRDFLARELEASGYETEVQRTVEMVAIHGGIVATTVENVLGRRRGTGNGTSLALVAHYDSVPESPGASDNAAAVAVLLETARALSQIPRPRNDVIVLFPDAEEAGLTGAHAFIRQHPWAADVGVVANFDARGHKGPVYMFQTGTSNGDWLSHFAAAAPHPRATSLFNHIYGHLPHGTDFTVFLEAGQFGFNMAPIEGLTHYHTMLDRPSEVDRSTLIHQASYSLGLARYLVDLDFSMTPRSPDQVYFNILGDVFIHYPRGVAAVLSALAGLLVLGLLVAGVRRRRLSIGGMIQGFLVILGLLIAVPISLTLVWLLSRSLFDIAVIQGSTPQSDLFMAALAGFGLALIVGVLHVAGKFMDTLSLWAGALVWWLIALVLVSETFLPVETHFVVAWPLLGAAIGLAYLLRISAEKPPSWALVAVLAVAAAPALLLLVPLIASLYIAFQSIFEMGGISLVPEVMLLGLLIPQIHAVTSRRPGLWVGGVALLATSVLALAILRSQDSESPRINSMVHAFDADTQESRWVTFDYEVDEWTGRLDFDVNRTATMGQFVPLLQRPFMYTEAPIFADRTAPEITLVDERVLEGGEREVRLRFRVTGASPAVRDIWFDPWDEVLSIDMGDQRVFASTVDPLPGIPPFLIRIPPEVPAEDLVLRLKGDRGVRVHVTDLIEGLPENPQLGSRPPETIRSPFPPAVRSDVTMAHRSFEIPPRRVGSSPP